MSMTPKNSETQKAFAEFAVVLVERGTYRKTVLAHSEEEALAMADDDHQRHQLDNWDVVTFTRDFEVIDEAPATNTAPQ